MLYNSFSLVNYFIHSISSVYMSIPTSQYPPFPTDIHMFVLYVCVSISALQIRSSIPFFLDSVYMLHIQYFSLSDLLFSCHVMSDSQRPHGLLHARLPCPSLSPRVCSDSHPLSQWCHPTISSSVAPFSSCPQFFPASGSFPMSRLFASLFLHLLQYSVLLNYTVQTIRSSRERAKYQTQ